MYNLYCSLPEEDGTEKYAYAEACIVTNQMGMEFDTYENQLLMYSEAPIGILGLIKTLFIFFIKFITSFYGLIIGAIIAILAFLFRDKSKKVEIGGGGGGGGGGSSSSSTSCPPLNASDKEVAKAGKVVNLAKSDYKEKSGLIRSINNESYITFAENTRKSNIYKEYVNEYLSKNPSPDMISACDWIYERMLSKYGVLREDITYTKKYIGLTEEAQNFKPLFTRIEHTNEHFMKRLQSDIADAYKEFSTKQPLHDYSALALPIIKPSHTNNAIKYIANIISLIADKIEKTEGADWLNQIISEFNRVITYASGFSTKIVKKSENIAGIAKELIILENATNSSKVVEFKQCPEFHLDSKYGGYISISPNDGLAKFMYELEYVVQEKEMETLKQAKAKIPELKDQLNSHIARIDDMTGGRPVFTGNVALLQKVASMCKTAISIGQYNLANLNMVMRDNQHPVYSTIARILSSYLATYISRMVYDTALKDSEKSK